jgi:hypothetical protein
MNIVNEDVLREYFNIDNSDQNEVDFIIGNEKVCNYDLSDRKQLFEACHYTNLQPLWAKDNLTKSDKII